MTCEACRTIPPVIAEGYEPKGEYRSIGGLNTCESRYSNPFQTSDRHKSTSTPNISSTVPLTNPDTTGTLISRTAIIDIYDIFGISAQTIQGADLLAARLNTLVLVPDFFKGHGARQDWIPMDTPEKEKALMGFFKEYAQFEPNVGVLRGLVDEYKEVFPAVEKWGVFGLCWGGKV